MFQNVSLQSALCADTEQADHRKLHTRLFQFPPKFSSRKRHKKPYCFFQEDLEENTVRRAEPNAHVAKHGHNVFRGSWLTLCCKIPTRTQILPYTSAPPQLIIREDMRRIEELSHCLQGDKTASEVSISVSCASSALFLRFQRFSLRNLICSNNIQRDIRPPNHPNYPFLQGFCFLSSDLQGGDHCNQCKSSL